MREQKSSRTRFETLDEVLGRLSLSGGFRQCNGVRGFHLKLVRKGPRIRDARVRQYLGNLRQPHLVAPSTGREPIHRGVAVRKERQTFAYVWHEPELLQ